MKNLHKNYMALLAFLAAIFGINFVFNHVSAWGAVIAYAALVFIIILILKKIKF
jgi:hypothetical protein